MRVTQGVTGIANAGRGARGLVVFAMRVTQGVTGIANAGRGARGLVVFAKAVTQGVTGIANAGRAALVDEAVLAFPERGPELELLELAGGGAGELLAELDRGRALVVRDGVATVCDEHGLVDVVVSGTLHHERLDRLAPLGIGHADHRDLRDRGVLEEAVLDLDRGHVLAAADDHVLLAVGDHHVRAVELATVAGVEPAVDHGFGRRLRLLPVALEHVVRAGQHLALTVDPDADADRRDAGARQVPRALRRAELVVLGRRPVHREEG